MTTFKAKITNVLMVQRFHMQTLSTNELKNHSDELPWRYSTGIVSYKPKTDKLSAVKTEVNKLSFDEC